MGAGSNLTLFDVILKSKEVFFESNKFDIHSCFIDADTLQLETSDPQSIFKAIRFTFNKNLPIIKCIQGILDFTSNETDGIFFVLGAQKVEILLSDRAFI